MQLTCALPILLLLTNILAAQELGPRITPDGRFFSLQIPKDWVPISRDRFAKQAKSPQLALFRPVPDEEVPGIGVALVESGRPKELKEPVDMAAIRRGIEKQFAKDAVPVTIMDLRLGDDKQSLWIVGSMQGNTGGITYLRAAIPVQTGYLMIDGVFPEDDPHAAKIHRSVVRSLRIDEPWQYKPTDPANPAWKFQSLSLILAVLVSAAIGWSNRRSDHGYTGTRPNWWKVPVVLILLTAGTVLSVQSIRGAISATASRPLVGLLLGALQIGLALWIAAGELPYFRLRKKPSVPRQPNPWKFILCAILLANAAEGFLNPLRGPLYMVNYAQLSGGLFANLVIGTLALWGLLTELYRWRAHAKARSFPDQPVEPTS